LKFVCFDRFHNHVHIKIINNIAITKLYTGLPVLTAGERRSNQRYPINLSLIRIGRCPCIEHFKNIENEKMGILYDNKPKVFSWFFFPETCKKRSRWALCIIPPPHISSSGFYFCFEREREREIKQQQLGKTHKREKCAVASAVAGRSLLIYTSHPAPFRQYVLKKE
jgi:hypothetical protein